MIGCGSKGDTDVTVSGANGEKIKVKSDGSQGDISMTSENGEKVNIDGKNGAMTMSTTDKDGNKTTASMGGNTTITEADLGVPFYPGSTEKSSGQAKIETDKEKNVISVRMSGDLPAKVLEFYKSKIKGSSTSSFNTDGTDMGICSGNLENGAKFSMTATRQKDAKETEIQIGVGTKK